jgi:hypothetical protein
MAHTVTLDGAKLSWDEFIAGKDIGILADYPECAGKTLDEVTTEGVADMIARQQELGLVSHNEDGDQIELTWESEEHHNAAKDILMDQIEGGHGVQVITPDGEPAVGPNGQPLYYTPFGYLQYLYRTENNS